MDTWVELKDVTLDRALFELHLVGSQGARLIREDVLYLAKIVQKVSTAGHARHIALFIV